MKTAAIIVLAVLFVLSLSFNLWFYGETTSLNREISSELRTQSGSNLLPGDIASDLRSNFYYLMQANQEWRIDYEALERTMHDLDKENRQVKSENDRLAQTVNQYETALAQIRQEAEQAQEFDLWGELLRLIFSF